MSTDSRHNEATRWFEPLYAGAEGQLEGVPWASGSPCPWVSDDLERHPASGRAIVVGCGLGDDAEALSAAGYQVVAFDVSPTAVQWCRDRFADSRVDYRVGDLFDLPADLIAGGDLVVEVRTIQALNPSVRAEAVDAVGSLVAPVGRLLLVALGRPDHVIPSGPPWAVSDSDLIRLVDSGLVLEEASVVRGQLVRSYRRS